MWKCTSASFAYLVVPILFSIFGFLPSATCAEMNFAIRSGVLANSRRSDSIPSTAKATTGIAFLMSFRSNYKMRKHCLEDLHVYTWREWAAQRTANIPPVWICPSACSNSAGRSPSGLSPSFASASSSLLLPSPHCCFQIFSNTAVPKVGKMGSRKRSNTKPAAFWNALVLSATMQNTNMSSLAKSVIISWSWLSTDAVVKFSTRQLFQKYVLPSHPIDALKCRFLFSVPPSTMRKTVLPLSLQK